MNAIVLFTAMTATSGLFGFGGGRTCATGTCGRGYVAAPSCYTYRAPASSYAPAYAAPTYAAPAAAYSAPAPAAPRVSYYQSNYAYPVTAGCPNGNCPRR
jgi:hypothetical protein